MFQAHIEMKVAGRSSLIRQLSTNPSVKSKMEIFKSAIHILAEYGKGYFYVGKTKKTDH